MTPSTTAVAPRTAWLGVCWLALLAGLGGLNAWLLEGRIVPYLDGGEPEYLILLHPLGRLFAWCLGSLAALLVLHFTCIRMTGVPRQRALAWPALRYLSPLVLLVLPVAAVLMLTTGLRREAGPWLYVSFDMAWWLVAVVSALLVTSIDRASGRSTIRRGLERLEIICPSTRARVWSGIALSGLLVASSLLFSPPLRFQSVLIGDEPKYLRYLENWYRGHGMDLADLGPIAEWPPRFRSNLIANGLLLGQAIVTVGGDMVGDARRVVGLEAPPRPGPARSQGGWFVEGKRGGIYQVHNPGFSLPLLPGYAIDRALSRTQDYHPQFPTDLYFTNLTVLVLYALWGWAIFQLLWDYTGRFVLSWMIAAIVFLSLPATAFAYQYYPEVTAGLIVALVARYALASSTTDRRTALAYGCLAGCLAWLHVRFLPLGLWAAVLVALTRRHDRATIGAFVLALVIPVGALSLYYYHVTGSLMPWAMYALAPDEALFSAARAWRDLPAFWFDRTWGLVAHTPIVLLALPGFAIMWRKDRTAAVAVVAAILLIAIPAAGHGYTGAFTTPLRLVAAVVPLLALPLAETAIAWQGSSWFAAAFALLGVISVQNGITYNVHLIKSQESLQAATIGGWLFPLLLPDFDAARRLTNPLTALWLVITLGLVLLPVVALRRKDSVPSNARGWSTTGIAATVIVVFAASSTIAAGVTGARFSPSFMLKAGDARDRLIHFELTQAPGIRWSSLKGPIDLRTYFTNPEETTATLVVDPPRPRPNAPVDFTVEARRPGNRPAWGAARIDCGDGSPAVDMPIEGSGHARHTYARAGQYTVRIQVSLWGLASRSLEETLRIGDER